LNDNKINFISFKKHDIASFNMENEIMIPVVQIKLVFFKYIHPYDIHNTLKKWGIKLKRCNDEQVKE
jgi:hypothetical protein